VFSSTLKDHHLSRPLYHKLTFIKRFLDFLDLEFTQDQYSHHQLYLLFTPYLSLNETANIYSLQMQILLTQQSKTLLLLKNQHQTKISFPLILKLKNGSEYKAYKA